MRDAQIRDWVEQLTRSLGNPRSPADFSMLERYWRANDHTAMLRAIRAALRLNMRLTLARVNSGGPEGAPALVAFDRPVPMFGTRAFADFRAVVYIRKEFLVETSFGPVVIALAHELSHIVLEAIAHPLRDVEEAVDLTAMLLGFCDFYVSYTRHERIVGIGERASLWRRLLGRRPDISVQTHHIGYLSLDEVRYAASLMRA